MDKLSLVGILVAVLAVYIGFSLEGGTFSSLLQLPAFVIVFGGTLGAVMLQTSTVQFFHAIRMLKWIVMPPKFAIEQSIEDIVGWAETARERGYLALEGVAEEQEDPFTEKALNLLVDGVEIDNLREALVLELELQREHNLRSANIFEAMGGYSPTIGILGAVLGLIQALGHLKEPDILGQGIATAFVATIYGVGFANLFFLPIANKLRSIVHDQSMYRELLIEGVIAIAKAENPHAIENRLSAFRLNHHES
jgi:chemotaxis protein MotA